MERVETDPRSEAASQATVGNVEGGSSPDPAAANLSHATVVGRAWEAGRAAHPSVPLTRADLEEGLLAMIARRKRLSPTSGGMPLSEALASIPAADAYLAVACDRGVPGAWSRLMDLHVARLARLARHHGASESQADEIASSLPGDLCLAPPDGTARTRLGTYDGSGSLGGWLGVIVLRRVLGMKRRRFVELDAPAADDQANGTTMAAELPAHASDPSQAVLGVEAVSAVVTAVAQAWPRLTRNEALAVLLKYRDGLPQVAIARVLAVGEPRVSRLVQAGLDKLRGAVLAAVPGGLAGGQDEKQAWHVLREALERQVASLQPPGDSSKRGRA